MEYTVVQLEFSAMLEIEAICHSIQTVNSKSKTGVRYFSRVAI